MLRSVRLVGRSVRLVGRRAHLVGPGLVWITLLASLSGCGSTEAPAPASDESTQVAPSDEGGEEARDEGGAGAPEEVADVEDEEEDEAEATPAPDTAPHEVVIVVVHDDPLLRSETRLLEVIAERMQMRRIDAVQREASEAEAAYARGFFAGEGDASAGLPASLAQAGTVVFFRVPPNREVGEGRMATRGFGGAIAFRRGDREPYLELRVDDEASWRGADEQLWPWLISLVRAQGAS
jgi:hypothetical protein